MLARATRVCQAPCPGNRPARRAEHGEEAKESRRLIHEESRPSLCAREKLATELSKNLFSMRSQCFSSDCLNWCLPPWLGSLHQRRDPRQPPAMEATMETNGTSRSRKAA